MFVVPENTADARSFMKIICFLAGRALLSVDSSFATYLNVIQMHSSVQGLILFALFVFLHADYSSTETLFLKINKHAVIGVIFFDRLSLFLSDIGHCGEDG
jgi:hypothetical protein